MTENEYQEAAAEFLNIWQRQISAMMVDPKFINSFLNVFKNMQSGYDATKATSHPTSTFDARDDMLAQLAFRLASCEQRLAYLENANKTTPKISPQAKPKKRTAKKSS